MKLRRLELDDAPFMLEWMHEKSIIYELKNDFYNKTLDDCRNFIRTSWNETNNLNLAIVDNNNIYMGTVSLKNITLISAEFAIVIRKIAMGSGLSKYAMQEIIRIGFEKFKLKKIYWCVRTENKRALKFYDKNEYQRINICNSELLNIILSMKNYTEEQIFNYIWYEIKV